MTVNYRLRNVLKGVQSASHVLFLMPGRSDSHGDLEAYLIRDISLAPIVQLHVVALVHHDFGDLMASEKPCTPAASMY